MFGEVPMSCRCPCVGGSFAGTYDFWVFAVLAIGVRPLEGGTELTTEEHSHLGTAHRRPPGLLGQGVFCLFSREALTKKIIPTTNVAIPTKSPAKKAPSQRPQISPPSDGRNTLPHS